MRFDNLTRQLYATDASIYQIEPLGVAFPSTATEAAAVAHAKGISLPFRDAAEEARRVARATASNLSSMLQDVRRGAPTEVDAINGAVVREAASSGVPVPVNESLWRLVAARVAAQAAPGEIVVSSTVRDLVAGSGLQFAARGPAELKGIPGEWQLWSVVA